MPYLVSRSTRLWLSCTVSLPLIGLGLPSAAVAQGALPPAAASNGSAPDQEDPNAIVITANKRAQRLQDAPLAVTALSGQTLQQMGANDFVDFAHTVPSLSFTDLGAGRQKVAIRGINVTIGAATVGYYLGESIIPATAGTLRLANPDPKLVDIERIEVLRGPQGTLYGSGSIGGTIRLLPQKPNLRDTGGYAIGELSATKGGGAGGEVQGVFNLPIVNDRLALRTAAWFADRAGFIDRVVGTPDPDGEVRTGRVVKKDLPHEHTYGFRSILRARIADGANVDLMVYRQRQHFNGFQDITGGVANPSDRLVQRFLADLPEPSTNSFWLYNATANIDLAPRVELVSSTSLYRGRQEATEEGTAVINEIFGLVFPNSLTETNVSHDVSHETRISARDLFPGFDAVVGIFYDREKQDRAVPWLPEGIGAALETGTDDLFDRTSVIVRRQLAGFGELTYRPVKPLAVTIGYRRFDIKYHEDVSTRGLFFDPDNPDTFVVSPTIRSHDKGDVKKANVAYNLTRDHMVYATYSEGFRPGFGIPPTPAICSADLARRGITTAPTKVAPDRVKNYELGAKTSWLNRALTVDAAVYRIDWANIQQSVFLECGFSLVLNAGKARSQGIEAEVTAHLSSEVGVGASASYTRAKVLTPDPATQSQKGDQLINVPKWQASAYLTYEHPIAADTKLNARLDIQHTGASRAAYNRLPSGAFDPLFAMGALTLVNARIGIDRERWSLTAFGNNLLNDKARQSFAESLILNVPTRPRYVINRPRTLGVEGTLRF